MKRMFMVVVLMFIVEGLFAQIQATERVPGIADVKLKMDKATAFPILQAKGWTIEPVKLDLKVTDFERYNASGFTLGSKQFEYIMDFYKGSLVRINIIYVSDNLFATEIDSVYQQFFGGLLARLTSLYGNPVIHAMNYKHPYNDQSRFSDAFIADCVRPIAGWAPKGYHIALEMKTWNGLVLVLNVEYAVDTYSAIIKSVTKNAFDTIGES